MTWRRAGSPAETYHRTAPQQNSAAPNAVEIHAEVERQMQERIATAREQGRAEAENAAQQRAGERAQPVLAAFQKMTENLASQGHRLRAEAERDTVKLAVAIARRILHREIALDPEVVLGLVKARSRRWKRARRIACAFRPPMPHCCAIIVRVCICRKRSRSWRTDRFSQAA